MPIDIIGRTSQLLVENKQLREENARLRGERDAYRDQVQAQAVHLAEAKEENTRLQQEWYDMNGECNRFRDENYKLDEMLSMANAGRDEEITRLEEENARHVQDKSDMLRFISELQEEKQTLDLVIDEERRVRRKYRERLAGLEEKLALFENDRCEKCSRYIDERYYSECPACKNEELQVKLARITKLIPENELVCFDDECDSCPWIDVDACLLMHHIKETLGQDPHEEPPALNPLEPTVEKTPCETCEHGEYVDDDGAFGRYECTHDDFDAAGECPIREPPGEDLLDEEKLARIRPHLENIKDINEKLRHKEWIIFNDIWKEYYAITEILGQDPGVPPEDEWEPTCIKLRGIHCPYFQTGKCPRECTLKTLGESEEPPAPKPDLLDEFNCSVEFSDEDCEHMDCYDTCIKRPAPPREIFEDIGPSAPWNGLPTPKVGDHVRVHACGMKKCEGVTGTIKSIKGGQIGVIFDGIVLCENTLLPGGCVFPTSNISPAPKCPHGERITCNICGTIKKKKKTEAVRLLLDILVEPTDDVIECVRLSGPVLPVECANLVVVKDVHYEPISGHALPSFHVHFTGSARCAPTNDFSRGLNNQVVKSPSNTTRYILGTMIFKPPAPNAPEVTVPTQGKGHRPDPAAVPSGDGKAGDRVREKRMVRRLNYHYSSDIYKDEEDT